MSDREPLGSEERNLKDRRRIGGDFTFEHEVRAQAATIEELKRQIEHLGGELNDRGKNLKRALKRKKPLYP